MTNPEPPVSVAITNFNGGDVLLDTIASCLRSEHTELEIIVVDDGSTDDSVERVKSTYPQVKLVELGRNTKRLNIVRNAGLKAASHDYVLLIDNDVTLEPNLIPRLLTVLQSNDDNACASPRLQYSDADRAIYWDGGQLHYLGASICANRGAPPDTPTRPPERNIGCGNVLFDRRKLAQIGYFDEAYWLGWADDGEIYYRLLAAGYECLHVSDIKALHIARQRTTERLAAQLHNRWMFMLKNYQMRTLLLSLPALLFFELMQLAFSIMKGADNDYLSSLAAVWRERRDYWPLRRQFAQHRVRGDKEILTSGPLYIASEHLGAPLRWALKIAEVVFNAYWRLIRIFL